MTLEILTSDLLSGFKHGFFTRMGGASSGVFEGLNCGVGSSDQAEVVAINRERVAKAMDVPLEHLVTVHQTHSAQAVPVDGPLADRPKADGLATSTPGIALGILTADCLPVLFADERASVIGAAHAGWKGAKSGVMEATIDAMETLGAERAQIHAVLGPAISQANYEVGQEFMEGFLDEDPSTARFFVNGQGDRMQFDLPGYALQRLRDAGVGEAYWIRRCTYADPEHFFSYRRSVHRKEADYGRLISSIRL